MRLQLTSYLRLQLLAFVLTAPAWAHDFWLDPSSFRPAPDSALFAFCLGADMVNVAREAMMAVGCIQAQRCHTGHCPAGVATQNRWLVRGLDPTSKAARLANYIVTLRKELTRLSHACGVDHPSLLSADHMEILDGSFGSRPLREVFGYQKGWELPSADDRAALRTALGASGDSGEPGVYVDP